MSTSATELRLAIAARAENLALVRQALAGLGDAARLDEATLGDLKQIATEACMNAVVHAYPDWPEPGRIEVRAAADDREVRLTVRDWGVGFRPRPVEAEQESLRLGMPLIASLSDRFEVVTPSDGGTEVRVSVILAGDGEPAAVEEPERPAREAEIAVTAGAAARPVIARVMAMAATRAGLSLDRMSDGVLLGDVISSHDAGDFSGRQVGVELDQSSPGTLWLRVGPFVDGGAQRLLENMEVPGMGISVSKLADRVDVESDGGGDYVVIELGR